MGPGLACTKFMTPVAAAALRPCALTPLASLEAQMYGKWQSVLDINSSML